MSGSRPARPARCAVLLGLAGLFCAALSTACGSLRVEAVPADASRELARARAALERGDGARAGEAARRAQELAPDWVAPARLLDDVERRALVSGEALERRLVELARAPREPHTLYLAGRLEGTSGRERFERASALAPRLAWPHHGLAWLRFRAGDVRGAALHGARALERARDPWERAYFAETLARYLFAAQSEERALAVLHDVPLAELEPHDRRVFAAQLATYELLAQDELENRRGFERACRLLADPELEDESAALLARAAFGARTTLGDELAASALEAALSGCAGPAARAVRAELAGARGAHALARALRAPEAGPESEPPLLAEERADGARAARRRALRLARGTAPAAVLDEWLQDLPARVVDAAGLPLDERLRGLVLAARALPGADGAAAAAFGEALLAAGWFVEAGGFAEQLAARDGPAAAELDARANAGRALLAGIAGALAGVDEGQEQIAPWGPPGEAPRAAEPSLEARRVGDLRDLLTVLQGHFDRFRAAGAQDLLASPTIDYAGFATLVHPGPTFSDADAREGRGASGAAVPGLARELASIGRFGIFGQAVGGGGPDGTVLRLLACEWVEGSHLGVPFAGTVAWCEGTEVPSRPARRGASITGAALHEGYWIDVLGVWREAQQWGERQADFVARGAALAPALRTRGPRLSSAGPPDPFARRRVYAAEGQAERVRLALLAERGTPPAFEELLAAVALHEEGHLCDRTRFLPPWQHPAGVLRLLLEGRFTPAGVARRLEYRAQLTALCVAGDPRILLAECLDAVDTTSATTEHAAAYQDLVADLVLVLERGLEEGAGFAGALDPDFFIVHQLHHLRPEDVRQAALRLAQRAGL